MPPTEEELEEAARRRAETSEAIVDSEAEKKLIVAGPGTGKTYNFRRALEAVGGGGLALTFIKALSTNLAADLGDLAQVNTFHGYCKSLAHRLPIEGLTRRFDYYPPLMILLAEDMRLLGYDLQERDLEGALHNLDDGGGVLTDLLQLGTYYDAVSHTDVVYRVLLHLEANDEVVPEFPLVVVDEYQDFSLLETRFIDVLATASPVLVAGDDDQALYGFKHASPAFIRALADGDAYERFDLPYCSRCTEAIVDAVNNVVAEAQDRGNLAGRIDREYLCYLPEKLTDSEAHPAIVWAACSVETNRAPYMGRYVAQQIGQIPVEDIAESHEERYTTALVIGRRHLVERVYEIVKESFPNAVMRTSEDLAVDALDGYRRLARNADSRLGWRILLHVDSFADAEEGIGRVLSEGLELVEILPDEYRTEQVSIAEIVQKLLDGEEVPSSEVAELEEKLGRPIAEIQAMLGRDEEEEDEEDDEELEDAMPSIICTSLLGAKGLSAGYVFIVGFNEGAFPSDPHSVTDDEVCKLIVGLSRTRKECHLVSCGRFGAAWTEPSSFLVWLGVDIEERVVNKDYW